MKKVIIMGATSGIGREIAILLGKNGWIVGVAGRRSELLEQMKEENSNITFTKRIDVTSQESPQQIFDFIEEMGGIDLYVHVAGIGWQNTELNMEKEKQTLMTNGYGFAQLVGTVFNYFSVKGEGQIACISSIAGTKGLGAAPSYSATKSFQQHYLESMAQLSTIRKADITITDIRPGFVATDLIAGSNFPMQMDVEYVGKLAVDAILKKKNVVVIDWKYKILVFFWKCIPRCLWIKLAIGKVDK